MLVILCCKINLKFTIVRYYCFACNLHYSIHIYLMNFLLYRNRLIEAFIFIFWGKGRWVRWYIINSTPKTRKKKVIMRFRKSIFVVWFNKQTCFSTPWQLRSAQNMRCFVFCCQQDFKSFIIFMLFYCYIS